MNTVFGQHPYQEAAALGTDMCAKLSHINNKLQRTYKGASTEEEGKMKSTMCDQTKKRLQKCIKVRKTNQKVKLISA